MEEAPHPLSPPGESQRIRAEIARFLQEERLKPKLDKLNAKRANNSIAEDDYWQQRAEYELECTPETWFRYAAKEVTRLQEVTHPVKFSHPQASGAISINAVGQSNAKPWEVGTHVLGDKPALDVACTDAKYLPIYKFLSLDVDGRSLIERAIDADQAFADALSDDSAHAAALMSAFATLPLPKVSPSSHKLAKQLYWPVQEGTYHLLAPLFSSSLAHAVYKRINDDRFSDQAKAARDARRNKEAFSGTSHDYRNLIIQSFGGSKPQNISQLNSERRGENYLLASVPPTWESPALRPPLKVDTVFSRYFERRREVRRLTEALRDFLKRVANADSNLRIRQTRAELVDDLCGEVLHFAAELQRYLEPGWSAAPDCRLNLAERCWLDPARSQSDEDFAAHRRQGDWKDEVCLRFGNWLNARLQTDQTHFGGPEALAWQAVLGSELKLLREEFDDE
ncbi:MAG: type I-F CRISPR-associated protein Csy1 [Proteobacteria bacterium]|nr:type I-F CRISPR-associated protein Csy1 [Pseudomonadota bacterium]